MINRDFIFAKVDSVYTSVLIDLMNRTKIQRKECLIEFLRRMTLWASHVNQERLYTNWYLFDVMNLVDESSFVEVSIVDIFCDQKGLHANSIGRCIIAYWINWVENKSKLPYSLKDLPDPFEPFAELLELGGAYIRIDGSGFFSAGDVNVNALALFPRPA